MSNTLDYNTAMKTLKEMFPNHSDSLINYILQQNEYNLDATIANLLDTQPDSNSQEVRYSGQHPGPTYSQQSPSAQTISQNQYQPVPKPQNTNYFNNKPAQNPVPRHVFPKEFLRWPTNSNTIKTPIKFSDISGVNGNYVQIEPLKEPPLNPNDQRMFDLDMYSAQNHDPSQTIPDWLAFKQKFAYKY